MMLLGVRKISHRKQIRRLGCVAACLEMVTGYDQEYIYDQLDNDGFLEPYPTEAAVRFLCREGIHMEKVGGSVSQALYEGKIYLVTCPSSVNPKMAHMIVAVVHEGSMRIFDPADDLESETTYSSSDWNEGHVPCFEYFLLTDCNLDGLDDESEN